MVHTHKIRVWQVETHNTCVGGMNPEFFRCHSAWLLAPSSATAKPQQLLENSVEVSTWDQYYYKEAKLHVKHVGVV